MSISSSPSFVPSIQHPKYSELKKSLNEAEQIYHVSAASSQASKEAMTLHLTSAYRSFKEIQGKCQLIQIGLENDASRIFYLFGKALYGGDMQASRRMLELSLMVQLVGLKALNNTVTPPLLFDNLADLPKQFPSDTQAFKPLENFLDQTSEETIVDIGTRQSKENAFNFAATLRWVGATYQNIDSFQTKEHAPLFEKLCEGASNIWKKIAVEGDNEWKKNCDWEVAKIIYNTKRHRHYLQHPDDVKGALDTLIEVESYLTAEGNSPRAQQMRAQIHNITAIELSKIQPTDIDSKLENLKLCYEATSKAEEIAASSSEFDPFLKLLFLHNKAAQALECLKNGIPVVGIETINLWFKQVVNVIEKENYNHFYHSNFLINAAKCGIYQQQWEEALAILDKANIVASMYQASSADMQERIKQLRSEILQNQSALATECATN